MDIWPFLRRIYHHLPEPPSTNFAYCAVSPSPYDLLSPEPMIYDIGAKAARGGYFDGLPPDATIICTDIQPGPGVDIVADNFVVNRPLGRGGHVDYWRDEEVRRHILSLIEGNRSAQAAPAPARQAVTFAAWT